MSLWPYMNYNLQGSFYTMKDKLYQYSVTVSKKYFDKAQKVREAIKTPEELRAYQSRMKNEARIDGEDIKKMSVLTRKILVQVTTVLQKLTVKTAICVFTAQRSLLKKWKILLQKSHLKKHRL